MNLVTTKFLTYVLERGQQGIKPLPPLSFSLNFPSLRLGEMLAQYLNGPTIDVQKSFGDIILVMLYCNNNYVWGINSLSYMTVTSSGSDA